MTRQEANREIVRILSAVVEDAPEQRFGQILANLGIINYELQPDGSVKCEDP